MKIQRIELENFRNQERSDWDLNDPVVLLLGINGVGKSTLIDAISWCLTGRCRGVDGKGAGQKDLIRRGQDGMGVTVWLDGWAEPISRSLHRAGNSITNLKTDVILDRLGVSETIFQGCLYGRSFFDLHHSEAKAMLMGLLNVTVPPSDLPGIQTDRPLGLDDLEARYKAAFEKRAALKRAVAAVQVDAVVRRVDLEGRDLDTLKADLRQVTTDYQAAIRTQQTEQQALTNVNHVLDQAKTASSRKLTVDGAIDSHQGMLEKAQVDLQAAKDHLATLEAEPGDDVSTLQSQVAEHRLLVEKLQRHEPDRGCVLSAAIPCLTQAKEFAGQIAKLDKQAKALEKRIKAGSQRAEAIAALRQQIRDGDRQVGYHEEQLRQKRRDAGDLDQLAGKVEDLKARQSALVEASTAADAEVTRLTERLGDLQTDVASVQTYTALVERTKAAQERRAGLERELAEAEAIVDLLGPKGVQVKALDAALDDFLTMINAALAPFGFSLGISVEPWKVLVVNHQLRSEAIPYQLLSAGEQLWTGAAFQLALAAASGLNFVALDAAEAVVDENRAILTQLVMTAPVDQVLVAMAKGANEPDPVIEGLQVIRMQPVPAVLERG